MNSSFIYHFTSQINIPPNVNILSNQAKFTSALSSTSLLKNIPTNALKEVKKLKEQIPKTIFSSIFPAKPILHNNFLCKPDSLLLITQQELKLPNVTCTSCEERSKQCLDCKYLRSETSPTDQINLQILRDSIQILPDPNNLSKKMVMIDYQFSTSPETAFKPELSNYVHGKASSIALYKRLKKKGILEDFH